MRAAVEAMFEAEMMAALGAEKGVGTLRLGVPQDRDGRFSMRLLERYQRSAKALVVAWRRCMCKASGRRR